MSTRLKAYLPVLQLLSSNKISTKVKCELLASPPLLEVVCLVALNTLKGRVSLTPSQKLKLKRYKKALKALATKSCSIKTKHKQIVQSGSGIFTSLLIPAISALAGLFAK